MSEPLAFPVDRARAVPPAKPPRRFMVERDPKLAAERLAAQFGAQELNSLMGYLAAYLPKRAGT